MATLTFNAVPGTTYYIALDAEDGTAGTVVLSAADLGGGGGVELPAGAVGMVDFINGAYLWGEDSLTADQFVDHPELIVPGVALIHDAAGNGDDPFEFIGDFGAYLVAGDFTAVVEWIRVESFCEPLHIQDADNNPRLGVEDGTSGFLAYDLNVGNERDLTDNDPPGAGETCVRHVVALTRTSSKLVMSLDGEAIISNGSAQSGTFTNAYGGGGAGSSSGHLALGRIVLYPPVDDADLPGLAVPAVMQPPENDDFADAITINLDDTLTGHNFLATAEAGEPNHFSDGAGCSVWWKFVAPSTGNFTVDLAGSNDNGWGWIVAVYTGSAVNALSEVGSAADWPAGPSLTFAATSGTTYWIAVDSWDSSAGAIQIAVTA